MNKLFYAYLAATTALALGAAEPPFSAPAIVEREQPDNRILIIAENHDSVAQRAYIKSLLPELKSRGYNTLLIEAPQKLAEDRDTLLDNLKSAPGILRQSDSAIFLYDQILDTSESLGFEIYGYDADVGWPWRTDTKPPLRAFIKRFVLKRNRLIARNLSNYLSQNPNAKAVMLIGRLHLGIRNDPTMGHVRAALGKQANYDFPSLIQKSTGMATFAISLCGGDFGRAHPHPYALQAIKQNAADQWRFALTRGRYNADLFLHIPQHGNVPSSQFAQNKNEPSSSIHR